MAPPTDHGTGPPQGHAITPPGATTSTGSITPKGATTPTGSVAPTDTAPYPFFVEYGSFKRASPEDRIRVAEIDGDIALNFISPTGQTEIIASTKILSEASLVFRKMLAPGPRDRIYTNEKPQVTQIEDWHLLPGVLQLCLVLHGKADKVIEKEDDGTLMLLRFAQVAKKFRAVEFLKPAISPKLLEPFVKRASERDDNSFRTDTDLATIAYLLDQEQMFSLFTRRLLMDHCKPLSSCASDLFKTINPYYILQLEEQRITAKQKIDDFLHVTANHHCSECPAITYDPELLVAIGQKLRPRIVMWPPSCTEDNTIREVLAAIESLDDFVRFGGNTYGLCCPNSIDFKKCSEAVHKDCKTTCDMASKFLPGLCLTCVKQRRTRGYLCQHQDFADTQLTKLDPIS